jgi:HSP20 family protein
MMRDLMRRSLGPTDINPFDRFFGDLLEPFGQPLSRQSWVPPVNIEETDEGYEVSAELPGLRPDEVEITVEQNVLTLAGERKWSEDAKNRNFHRVERGYGRFVRSFALPQQVASDRVDARFDNGVLHVSIPKAEGAKPRRIQIHEGSPSSRSVAVGTKPQTSTGASRTSPRSSGKQIS